MQPAEGGLFMRRSVHLVPVLSAVIVILLLARVPAEAKWEKTTDKSEMDDSVTTTFILSAAESVKTSAKSVRPSLGISCIKSAKSPPGATLSVIVSNALLAGAYQMRIDEAEAEIVNCPALNGAARAALCRDPQKLIASI